MIHGAHAFTSQRQEGLYGSVLSQLAHVGYQGDLLQQGYEFKDWFAADNPNRIAPAAAFGQTPLSYDSACIAVLLSDGKSGPGLLREYRALGAPLAFEVLDDKVLQWRVASEPSREDKRAEIQPDEIQTAFRTNSRVWSPRNVMRAKNIRARSQEDFVRQLDFFDLGLIPALEEHIRVKLDPLLREALLAAIEVHKGRTGRDPDPRRLFQLAFWLLAGKVFHDRDVAGFKSLAVDSGPDLVLQKVAKHYSETIPRLLDADTRRTVHHGIWSALDFRNISVDILAHLWANTFVTNDVRRRLGIHCTPRALAKYIVDRLPFEDIPEQERFVLEPCCGSGTFLVAAMQRLKDLLPEGSDARTRHHYFTRMLSGFEQEVFGIEITRLGLTLADFPNPNGWRLTEADVFKSKRFPEEIKQARVVLCNPPHEDFDDEERSHYELASVHKPVEILNRVLDALHPDGMLGFVLPRQFTDGRGYRDLRGTLVERFTDMELVSLPDKVFEHADQETVLLIAFGARRSPGPTSVLHRKVESKHYERFRLADRPTHEDRGYVSRDMAQGRLAIPDLNPVWEALQDLPRLGEIADVHRGIEWNIPLTKNGKETGNRGKLVSESPRAGFRRGLPPLAQDVYAFQCPGTQYLNMQAAVQRGNAYKRPWEQPKVFVNAVTKSRGRWRIAAFCDSDGLVCYQNYTAIWTRDAALLRTLAALLNSPVSNAFAASHEGKRHLRKCTLEAMPVPRFPSADIKLIDMLINLYLSTVSPAEEAGPSPNWVAADNILRQIDLVILRAYALPSELQAQLLGYFDGEERIVPFRFMHYCDTDLAAVISLEELVAATEDWHATNGRRVELIQKRVSDTANSEEGAELSRLQAAADWRVRLLAPLPLRQVERLYPSPSGSRD